LCKIDEANLKVEAAVAGAKVFGQCCHFSLFNASSSLFYSVKMFSLTQ